MGQKIRTVSGCRDCSMCTGHAFTGFGREFGRWSADLSSLGITALMRKKCRVCEHPMSEHHVEAQQVVVVQQQQPAATPIPLAPAAPPPPMLPPAPPPVPPPGWSPAGWRQDPTDARCVCWWDGYNWHPQTKRPK